MNFTLAKKILVDNKLTDTKDVNCKFDFYVKRFDFANQQYKYCDTLVEGHANYSMSNVLQIFADIQDEESMSLVKNGEVANHTRIRVNHPKYKVFYKQNVQRPYIFFK